MLQAFLSSFLPSQSIFFDFHIVLCIQVGVHWAGLSIPEDLPDSLRLKKDLASFIPSPNSKAHFQRTMQVLNATNERFLNIWGQGLGLCRAVCCLPLNYSDLPRAATVGAPGKCQCPRNTAHKQHKKPNICPFTLSMRVPSAELSWLWTGIKRRGKCGGEERLEEK